MNSLWGLLWALAAGTLAWGITSASVANLPSLPAHALLLGLVAFAVLVTFLAGAALSRRIRRSREHLWLFGAVCYGVAGGLWGGAYAVALTIAYTRTYAPLPLSGTDMVLTALAYPVLAAFGFAVGAMGASVCGLLAAGLLRLMNPAGR